MAGPAFLVGVWLMAPPSPRALFGSWSRLDSAVVVALFVLALIPRVWDLRDDTGNNNDVYVVKANGQGLRQITTTPDDNEFWQRKGDISREIGPRQVVRQHKLAVEQCVKRERLM